MAQTYFQRNFKDALEYIIPQVYFETDYDLSGDQVSQVDTIINSHINFCINQASLLDISAVGVFSGINSVSGLSRWFKVQNSRINNITPLDLELNIVHPLGYCTGEMIGKECTFFDGSGVEDVEYFTGTTYNKLISFFSTYILPKIYLNSSSLASTTASAFSTTASGSHEYLIDKMGWAYFLNTSADSIDPSSYVTSALANLYASGTTFSINDGIKGLDYYLWNNWTTLSSISSTLLPEIYYSGTGEYTSGTQGLDNLDTLVDVIYSNKYINKDDSYVSDAFSTYGDSTTFLSSRERKGPFSNFVKGISYSMFDTNNEVSKLTSLYDIENCPPNLLKYMASLIGWELKGSSVDGWRRQIRFATSLYKQKGTKEGIYNALTTVLPATSFDSSRISEFYESYIPFLVYYLLNTDSELFESFDNWTYDKADSYTGGEYSYADMDLNIRYVIDNMLLKAVNEFPELFYVRNFQFNTKDPDFVFEYRGRSFSVPPWEEIKFYKDCDLTLNLVNFFKNELICLGVSEKQATNFYDYIVANTVEGNSDARYYSNGFWFLTSSLNIAPNESAILDNYQVDKYDFLSLWNGKSSHFNVSVSSGSFTSNFFETGTFTKQDYFQSLSIIDDFAPAKAISRTHVDLSSIEDVSSMEYTCPSVRYWVLDLAASGCAGGAYSSGVDIGGIPGAMGADYTTPPNSDRSVNNHTNLPVFKRDFVDSSLDKSQLMGSSVSAAPLVSNVYRTNTRRRNFSKNLQKGGWYTRTGVDMPNYFNLSSGGADTDFAPLGYVNTMYQYHPVINPLNLYEVSTAPYNFDLWSECWTLESDRSMSGIAASSTFDIRGTTAITSGSCNEYVRRERGPEFPMFLHKLLDKKYTFKATAIAEANKELLDVSSFQNPIESIKNRLWAKASNDLDVYYDSVLGSRVMSIGSKDGIHKMFKDYIDYFTNTGVGNGVLETYRDGGATILSQAYGPLFLNGTFKVDGSGLSLSSQLVAPTVPTEAPFTVKGVSALNNVSATSVNDMPVEFNELRNPYILSGMEFTDSSGGNSKFSIFKFDKSTASLDRDNYTVNNPLVVIDPSNKFARLRFSLKDYGEFTNLLIPERDFTLTVNAAIGTNNSDMLGGGSIGVWIHTEVQNDYKGDKVFWNYMPDGTWKMMKASVLQSKGAINLVKGELAHSLDYLNTYKVSTGDACFVNEAGKEVIGGMQESDFITRKITFNTRNSPIKVPYLFYKAHQQVHTTAQNYIVEVFVSDNSTTDMYGIFDYISVRDDRQYTRTKIRYPITYNDYSARKQAVINQYTYYNSSGVEVPSGTSILVDSLGNFTTSDADKLTVLITPGKSVYKSLGFLYSQLSISFGPRYSTDNALQTIHFKTSPYEGIIELGASGIITTTGISIFGKTKGSNIKKEEVLFVPLNPEEVLIVLREFNKLQKGLGARNASISEGIYGPQGGSRLNYRSAPMWHQTGDYVEFMADGNEYTEIAGLEN